MEIVERGGKSLKSVWKGKLSLMGNEDTTAEYKLWFCYSDVSVNIL